MGTARNEGTAWGRRGLTDEDQVVLLDLIDALARRRADARLNDHGEECAVAVAAAGVVSDLPPVLTVTEVAALLRIHFDTAYRQIKAGSFPVRTIVVGNRRKILRSDLERFLAGKQS